MNIARNYRKFREFISPAIFAARATYPGYREKLKRILGYTLAGTLIEAGALGLVYVLLQLFTTKPVETVIKWPFLLDFTRSPLLVSLACALLLVVSIRLKFLAMRENIGVTIESSRYAGQLALTHVRHLVESGKLAIATDQNRKALINPLLKTMPPSVGFAARSLCQIAMNATQGAVVFTILLYLSPSITIAVTLVGGALLLGVSNAFENFQHFRQDLGQNTEGFQEDALRLADSMLDTSLSAEDFSTEVSQAMSSGSIDRQMQLRMAMRTERSTGSLMVEYAYPLAIVGFALIYMYSGDWAPEISEIALYFLLIRMAVSSLYGIGSTFMAISRHYQPVLAFYRLMVDDILPKRLGEVPDDIE